jgi:hypothetical protein
MESAEAREKKNLLEFRLRGFGHCRGRKGKLCDVCPLARFWLARSSQLDSNTSTPIPFLLPDKHLLAAPFDLEISGACVHLPISENFVSAQDDTFARTHLPIPHGVHLPSAPCRPHFHSA